MTDRPSHPIPAKSLHARRAARIELLAPIEFPLDLPVVLRREELAQAICCQSGGHRLW